MSCDETEGRADARSAVTRRAALGALGLAAAAGAAPAAAAPGASDAPVSLLYPFESPTRATRDLSGLWRFKLDRDDAGERARWFDGLTEARPIPVPCSWNDLFDDAANYFGAAWYETDIWIEPRSAASGAGKRRYLRFGAADYHATVWLNGHRLGEHQGAHLPFAFDVTAVAVAGQANRLTVRVENQLRLDRVPAIPDPQTAHFSSEDYPQTTYDFFPYAGLHRPVWLQTLPAVHLHDLTVVTDLAGDTGVVTVDLEVSGGWSGPVRLTLDGGPSPVVAVASVGGGRGRAVLRVPGVRPWSPKDPFLYRLTVAVGGAEPLDVYALKVGVRTVKVSGSRILLNGEPLFLKGFGKHEDFAIHGKGLDLPVLVRDFELLKWIGANSFRTSHYPYAEEALQLADQYGFLVIDETPGVSLVFSDPQPVIDARYRALETALTDLVRRDRNHPCVILWSLANEPIPRPFHTGDPVPPGAIEAGTRFFDALFAKARTLDATRPVSLDSVQNGPAEWVGHGDVICTNSYNGWYVVSGRLDDAERRLDAELVALRARHGDKPILFLEFGADAVAGVHAEPAVMWSEEYQADLIEMYWRVLRRHPYVVGAHPWAFADFKTPQSIMRVGALNQKGVFTRDRRPKLAASRLRALWT